MEIMGGFMKSAACYFGGRILEKPIDQVYTEIVNFISDNREIKTVGEFRKFLNELSKTYEPLEDLSSRNLQKKVEDLLSKVEDTLDDIDHLEAFTSIPGKFQSELDNIKSTEKELIAELQEIKGLQQCNPRHSNPELRGRESGAVHCSNLYGREREKQELIDFLLRIDEGEGKNYSVYAIVGMGGIGKTAIAQHVFDDNCVNNLFEKKVWMCVWKNSREEIYRGIIEYINEASCAPFVNLKAAEDTIKGKLRGKRFLIVLDDIWDMNRGEFESLCAPFNVGRPGSKIVVTTRNVRFQARNIEGNKPLSLLQESDCWNLLCERAGKMRKRDEPEIRKMLKRCDGLPQQVIEMGDDLASHKENWKLILEKNFLGPNTFENLKLSYDNLPKHLRSCFAFMSMFPEESYFEEKDIQLKWGGAGLIKRSNVDCFQDLVSKSLFLPSNDSSGKECFKMHSLMRNVALTVSNGKFCTWNDAQQWLGCKHLFCDGVSFEKCHRLLSSNKVSWRSFTLCGEWNPNSSCNVASENVVKKMKIALKLADSHGYFDGLNTLRLLSFHGSLVNFSHMKHLRYVSLANTSFTQLPSCVTALRYLEVLILNSCKDLIKLPDEVGNLVNLCYLDIAGCCKLTLLQRQMNKLMNLSSLIISSEVVSSLSHLNKLTGKLSIHGLEDLPCQQIHPLTNLLFKDLSLEWKNSSGNSDENILACLQPNQNVRKLSIRGYRGKNFPNWLKGMDFLEELIIKDCPTSTISFPQLPAISKLKINNCEEVKCCDDFSLGTLDTLELLNIQTLCPKFKEKIRLVSNAVGHLRVHNDHIYAYLNRDFGCEYYFKMEVGTFYSIWNEERMHVESFTVYNSDIKSLPHWIHNVKYVVIEDCNNLTSISLQGEGLHKLRIANCLRLGSITSQGAIPSTLSSLEIINCDGLGRLWPEAQLSPCILTYLTIKQREDFPIREIAMWIQDGLERDLLHWNSGVLERKVNN